MIYPYTSIMATSIQQNDMCLWVMVMITCLLTVKVSAQQTQYNMDDTLHCNNAGLYDIPDDTTIYVNARSSMSFSSSIMSCSMVFRAASQESSLDINFNSFYINDGNVKLHIVSNGGLSRTYKAGFSKPSSLTISGRQVTIQLDRTTVGDRDYNFQLTIVAKRNAAAASISDSNPMAVGLVVGIVGAILGSLIIASIIGICCYKQIRKKQLRAMSEEDSDSKVRLDERDPSSYSIGFTNTSMSNGRYGNQDGNHRDGNKRYYPNAKGYRAGLGTVNDGSSRGDVGYYSDNKKYPSDNDTVEIRPNQKESPFKRPQTINNLPSSPKSSSAFHYNVTEEKVTDNNAPPTTSPFLAALHSNSKFRRSFHSSEAEADERAKRISNSSLQSDISGASISMSPGGPTSAPALPSVPVVPMSPTAKHQEHAQIRRAARPTSASSEELEAISRGQEGDRNIKLIREDDAPSSPIEIVPIKTRDPYSVDKKDNTQHSLKPQRGRSPQEKRKRNDKPPPGEKQTKEQSSQGYVQKEQKDYGGSLGRRGKKSPRLGITSKGFGHRNKSENDPPSRPGTPTSIYSRDDLESLPPLQRSASKQSLYASRSSLYGRRRRKGSFTGSVSSYARDDMEVYRRSRDYDDDDEEGGYEKPISRKEREQMFRSVGDIGKVTKATQTLRETATQTGQQEPYILQSKIIMKKKGKPRSQSVAATQTAKSKPKSRKAMSISVDAQLVDKGTVEKKLGKTLDNIDSAPETHAEVSNTQPGVKKTGSPINVTSDGQFVVAENANIITQPMTFTQTEATHEQQQQPIPVALGQQVPFQYQQGYPPQNMGMQFPQQQQPYGVVHPQNRQAGWQNSPPSNVQQFHAGIALGPGNQQPGTSRYQQQQEDVGPPKPRKSNWDMLCEITDNERQKQSSDESASVASSVFTSNVPLGMPGAQYGPPGISQTPPMATYTATTQPMKYNAYPQPYITGLPQQQSPTNVSVGSGKQTSAALPHQSSWDTLKQLTDNPYKLTYGTPSESNHTDV